MCQETRYAAAHLAGCRVSRAQLAAAKGSQSNFRPMHRKTVHISKAFVKCSIEVQILPSQPGSPALREAVPNSRRNARQQRAFLIQRTVSSLPISPAAGRNCRKSLATCRNIPNFGRRRPETGFDPHWVADAAVQSTWNICFEADITLTSSPAPGSPDSSWGGGGEVDKATRPWVVSQFEISVSFLL